MTALRLWGNALRIALIALLVVTLAFAATTDAVFTLLHGAAR
ncbi:hypothetical protein [Dactylosporangium sp. CA-139066]